MKWAVIILALLGGLASLGLGAKWVKDYNDVKEQIASVAESAASMGGAVPEELAKINGVRNAGYAAMPLGILAILAGFLVGKLGGKVTGGVLLATGVIPAVFAPQALVATGLLLVAGGLAFLVKPKVPAAVAGEGAHPVRKAA